MITLIIIGLAFIWLGYETDWMRVRLLVGISIKPFPNRWFDTFNLGKWAVDSFTAREGEYSDNGHRQYLGYAIKQTLSNAKPHKYIDKYVVAVCPGIKDVLCGKAWLDKHWNDLADYRPKVEMSIGGVRYNMTIKQPTIIKDIMKANKLTKKQKLAYA